jgi:hypothetical protein
MLNAETRQAIAGVARDLGVEPAALAALVEIESAGRTHAMVAGKGEPLIRFEGHYFDRRLSDEKRALARQEGLASPQVGGIRNPASQPARWNLLRRAATLDRVAAYESTSWGVGQVMGAHWAWLDYATVDALVAEARNGVAGQLRLMARYLKKAGLLDALRKHDWPAVARGYNGPAYRRNRYDTKLANSYERYARETFEEQGPKPVIDDNKASARRSVALFDSTIRFFANLLGGKS